MDSVDGGFAEPTLAAHFAGDRRLTGGHGSVERRTQIKIAADAFVVKTIETEHRLGVTGVDHVFDLPVAGDPFRGEVGQLHRQRFQFPKLLREADGLFGPLAFLLTVIRARTEFWRMHPMLERSIAS